MASGGQNAVLDVYRSIISDVVNNVREAFLDDGADEHALAELRNLWETKVRATGAVDWDGTGRRQMHQVHAHPALSGSGGRGEKRELSYAGASHAPKPSLIQTNHGIPLTTGGMGANSALSVQQQAVMRQAQAQAQAQQVLQSQMLTSQVFVPGRGVIQIVQGQPGVGGGMQMLQLPTGQIISKLDVHQRHPPQALTQTLCAPEPWRLLELDGADYASTSKAGKKRKSPGDEPGPSSRLPQLDGPTGLSDDEDSDGDELLDVEDEVTKDKDDDDDEEEEEKEAEGEQLPEEGEPLNSDDDEQDEDEEDGLFDSDNTVVCQYDKVQRVKNKWKFVLKDGVMNIDGKDYIFAKATGEAEW